MIISNIYGVGNIEYNVLVSFLIAAGLGALIGLEREMGIQKKKIVDFGGFRTFILIAFFGALVGYLSTTLFDTLFLTVISFAFFILAIAAYIITGLKSKHIGATTEISSVITFFLGMLCSVGLVKIAVVFTVFVVLVLALKPSLHNFAKKVDRPELFATIKFALISLVILPFLPNIDYTPLDIPIVKDIVLSLGIDNGLLMQLNIFNPYHIWLMVVFITAISYAGYILIRLYGAGKGLGITGFLGGLVSSTAVTFTLSAEAAKNKKIHKLLMFE